MQWVPVQWRTGVGSFPRLVLAAIAAETIAEPVSGAAAAALISSIGKSHAGSPVCVEVLFAV